MKAIWLILLLSVVSVAAEEKRTWTFIEDGVMRSPSGGGIAAWSFKKNGRVDAAFLGLEGTNVIVLTEDGKRRTIPTNSLSENDRAYLKKASGISKGRAGDIEQKADANSPESKRESDVSGLEAEAASKRHQDHLKIEAGMSREELIEEANMGRDEARREFVRYDYGENPTDRLGRNYDRLTRILGPNYDSYYSINRTNMSAYELGELMENLNLRLQTLTDLRERRAIVDRDIKQLEIDSRQRLLKSILFGD